MRRNKLYTATFSFLLMVLTTSFTIVAPKKNPNYIRFTNKDSKEKLLETIAKVYAENKTPVLVYTASWCGSCTQFKKFYNANDETREVLKDIVFLDIDLSKVRKRDYNKLCVTLAAERNISRIPAFTMVDENAEEQNRIIGATWINSIENTSSFVEQIQKQRVHK